MSNELPVVNPIPDLVVPSSLVPSPADPSVQTVAEFFQTRNFARLFGALGVGSTAIVAYLLYQKYVERRAGLEKVDKLGDTDENLKKEEKKVILYQVPRGFFTPAVAPFALKLETFMRVSKISYEVHLSTTKKEVDTPWLKVGDEQIRNNNDCISFLCNKFNIQLSKESSSSRKTASRMVDVMLESRIYWAIALWRWVYDEGKSMKDIQPLAPSGEAVLDNVRESVMRAAHYQGIGRMSQEEVVFSVIQDLTHLSAALGKHQYFMGDSPGEVDCNAFSLLAQMVWNMPGSPFEEAIKKHKTLMDFVIRMREKFWPDWDDLIQNPQESQGSSGVSVIDPHNVQDSSAITTAKSNVSVPASKSKSQQQDTSDTGDATRLTDGTAASKSITGPMDRSLFASQSQSSDQFSKDQSENLLCQQAILEQVQQQIPQQIFQLRNPQPLRRPQDLQVPQQPYQLTQPGQSLTIREIIQNQKPLNRAAVNNVNMTEQQLYQMHNHQLVQQGENQNAFQQVRNGIQDMNKQIGSTNLASQQQYMPMQPQGLHQPQYIDQTVQQQSQLPAMDNQMNYTKANYASEKGQYYPEVDPASMHERLNRAAQATLYQQDLNLNHGYAQHQSQVEHLQQHRRNVEPDQLGSNQSQMFNKFWH